MTAKRRTTRILRKQYAVFRPEVVDFFSEKVLPQTSAVLDPMAGTSPLVPYVEYYGLLAHFNDILPVHSFVNRAKTYPICCEVRKIEEKRPGVLRYELRRCMSRLENHNLVISDKWIQDDVLDGLLEAWARTAGYGEEIRAFFQAVIVLCVREYSCMSPTAKNSTWNRPGGMTTEKPLGSVVQGCMDRFFRYYDLYYGDKQEIKGGTICFSTADVRSFEASTRFDVILTSPAYPNRYDSVIAYAPEICFLSRCVGTQGIDELRTQILGTNVVKDYQEHDDGLQWVRHKSRKTGAFLAAVREKQLPGERRNDYYFRCFTKYYSALYESLDKLITLLTPEGSLYVVVQNNIHRGELNDLCEFIPEYFLNQGLTVTVEKEWTRSHQGRRNISRNHPLVLKRHIERVIRAQK